MIVKVKVIPNAKKDKIEQLDHSLRLYVTASPIDGKANKKVIEMLSRYYQTKKYNVKIVRGDKHRDKIIEII
ncbi:MAG: DUF167 domain-containing protein [Candidatus Omnitrophota bacterium]